MIPVLLFSLWTASSYPPRGLESPCSARLLHTKSAKESASTAGVRLIDRDGLQSYLDDYNQKLIEVFQAEEESR
jgi:hypothetical protein